MKKLKSKKALAMCVAMIMLLTAFVPQFTYAFRPGSHYVIMEKVTQKLAANSQIRAALAAYPQIAAWGAVGPDLGYAQGRALFDYAPWADRCHYDRIGTFAATQLRDALASGDQKKIAWAAGWVTHVTGDLAAHGIFVNPETGVYLENSTYRDLHSELEKCADTYIWQNNHPGTNVSSFFASTGDVPNAYFMQPALKVYGIQPSSSEVSLWLNAMSLGLNPSTDYNTALNTLNQSNRLARLNQAVSYAADRAATLLADAESGNYSGFTDRWNLDAAEDSRPIGTLTATIKTSTDLFSGSDGDIYFGMQLSNGKTKEWLLDKAGYNDFENGDNDDYYLYVGDSDFYPSNITKVWIRKSGGDDWKPAQLSIRINGKQVFSQSVNKWITSGTPSWSMTVSGLQ